jgi:transcriptional regulator with XRE-family HTH domain
MKEHFHGPLDLVQLRPLMEATSGAPEIKIGLIDGPVALDHPELSKGHIRELAIGAGRACTRQTSLSCVHGTFIAGVLSATRNGEAPAICPSCTLVVRPIFGEAVALGGPVPSATPEELAEKLGVTQQMIGYLERQPVAIRPELLLQLSDALGVSLDELLGQVSKPQRATGPTGKMRQLFTAVSRLPRSQQEKILAILQPFVREHVGNS